MFVHLNRVIALDHIQSCAHKLVYQCRVSFLESLTVVIKNVGDCKSGSPCRPEPRDIALLCGRGDLDEIERTERCHRRKLLAAVRVWRDDRRARLFRKPFRVGST